MTGTFTLIGGTANAQLTDAVGRELGVTPAAAEVERFPDGEVSVRLLEPVRRKEVFLLQPTSPPVDEHLMELLCSIGRFVADGSFQDLYQ